MGDIAAVHRASFAHASAATVAAFPEPRRMRDQALSRFLHRKRYLMLASTRGDGRPHAAMSAFVLLDGRFWCPTMAGTVRARNIARDPRVSLVITEGEGDAHAVVLVEGDSVLVDEHDEPDRIRRHYEDRFAEVPDWARSWIVVDPTRVLSFAGEDWT